MATTSNDIERVIAKLGVGDEFPGLPQTFAEVLQINPQEDGAFDRYLRCLKHEPGLAAKVLKVANSALMGSVAEVTNLRSALVRLGTTATHSAVISTLVMDLLKADVGLLRHCVGCGAFAARLSSAAGLGNPDDFFAAGMLHDIGKVFLLLAARNRGEKTPPPGYGETGLAKERTRYGVDHTQLGAWLATRWGFPESLRSVIRDHHAPPPGAPVALGLIVQANEWTHSYYESSLDNAPCTKQVIEWFERNLNLPRERFLEAAELAPGDVAELVDDFLEQPVGTHEVLRLLQRANIALGEINFRHEFLHRRMIRQLRNLTLLQGLGSEVAACAGQKAMCDKVVELVSTRLHLGVVSILMPSLHGKLFVQSAVGLPKEIVGHPNKESEGSIGRWVFERGHALLLKDFSHSSQFHTSPFASRYVTASALSVPLKQGPAALGVLNVNNKGDGSAFDEEDQQFFEVLGNSVGALLHAESERVKRERADQRFRSLAAKTPIAMVGFDLSGAVWLWNRAAHVLTDIAPADAVGARLPSALLPGGDEGLLNQWTTAVRDGRAIEREECALQLPDGAEGQVLYSVFPLESNTLGVWAGVNITKEKAAQFRAERRAVEMEATQQVLHEILEDLDQQTVINSFADRLARVLSVERCLVMIRNPETKALTCVAHIGCEDAEQVSDNLDSILALADRAYSGGEFLVMNSPVAQTAKIRAFLDVCQIRNLLAGPLRIRQDTVGLVCVFNRRERGFNEDDVSVLRDLANVASVGLRVTEAHAQRVHDEQLRTAVGMTVTYNHEINNPLQIILSCAELAGKHPKLPEELKIALRQIEESAERIANVNERLRSAVMLTFRDYLGDLPMVEVPRKPKNDPRGE